MSDGTPASPGPFRSLKSAFHGETGQSLGLWAFVALFSFFTQIVLFRGMVPGEFGTLNTALGVIGLATVPLLAVRQAFLWHLARQHGPDQKERLEALRAASPLIIETFTWIWGVVACVLLLITLPLLAVPRFPVYLFILLNVLVALGGLLSGTMCRNAGKLKLWAWLVVSSLVARLVLSTVLTISHGWAESALAAFLIAGLITFMPALRVIEADESQRLNALRTALDRAFLLELGAIFSVFLAIFLFSSADRIVAQSWFGTPPNDNVGYVDWSMFDAYQAAGLLGRSILWGTQPLLVVLYVQRSRLARTTVASMEWFWIYLFALIGSIIFLELFHVPLSEFFCGKDCGRVSYLVPGFALTMIPLGLLQGLGIFGLASRRYLECFVLGACGIAYFLLLYLVGRQPQLMLAYMFGGGLVSLMIVLFVGVVRWGRKQP